MSKLALPRGLRSPQVKSDQRAFDLLGSSSS
jgi:hypothetical protein